MPMMGQQIYSQAWTRVDHHVVPWVNLTLPGNKQPQNNAGAKLQMPDDQPLLVE